MGEAGEVKLQANPVSWQELGQYDKLDLTTLCIKELSFSLHF